MNREEHTPEKEAAAYAADPAFIRCQIHRHRSTTELSNVMMAIEMAGASPALTDAILACAPLRDAIHDLLDERDTLRAEAAAQRQRAEQAGKYLSHLPGCDIYGKVGGDCSCGLSELTGQRD